MATPSEKIDKRQKGSIIRFNEKGQGDQKRISVNATYRLGYQIMDRSTSDNKNGRLISQRFFQFIIEV